MFSLVIRRYTVLKLSKPRLTASTMDETLSNLFKKSPFSTLIFITGKFLLGPF